MGATRPAHPLAPLSIDEISAARDIVVQTYSAGSVIYFRAIELEEPKKADLVPFLASEHADTISDSSRRPPRSARATYNVNTGKGSCMAESLIDLGLGKQVKLREFDVDFIGPTSLPDIVAFMDACKTSPLMVEALKEFKIPSNFVLSIGPWPYGGPDLDSDNTRYIQALIFARDTSKGPDSNHYPYPVPLVPVYDIAKQEVVRVDRCATGGIGDPLFQPPPAAEPRELFKECTGSEYVPELLPGPLRDDLKPLNVTQPDGPSFSVSDGNLVEWQKWRFRLGYTTREGAVMHDLTYEDRPVLFRLSFSEMSVPYADPRPPFHHKQAFDFGDGLLGLATNNLQLGCDCLGQIHYFSIPMITPDGTVGEALNRVCMHEQDNGILWKHTMFETKRTVVVRMRELVVQFIATLGNYEYVFAYKLDQAGGITVETRATGVVSVAAIDPGKESAYGNVMQTGVLAQNHQHLIAMRIDPAIDSYEDGDTGVMVEESRSMPIDEDTNPYGNAYEVVRTPVDKACWVDAEPKLNRIIRMVNWNKKNPNSGRPVGYKFTPTATQLILADPKSRQAKRALFATHHVWVTGHRDGELWAAGEWTNLSKQEERGVADMVQRGDWFLDSAADTPGSRGQKSHPVVWSVFGLTHNPRTEDWPVMPAEIHTLHIKPSDFFPRNPALDVPSGRNTTSVMQTTSCCGQSEKQARALPEFAAAHWQAVENVALHEFGAEGSSAGVLTDPSTSDSGGRDETANETTGPALMNATFRAANRRD